MKAPNKIYVDDLAVINDQITKVSTKPLNFFSPYLRRGTILEMLRVERDRNIFRSDEWDFYQKVINAIGRL